MSTYDRQLIIVFPEGEHDRETELQAAALNAKERADTLDSEIVPIRCEAGQPDCFSSDSIQEVRLAISGRAAIRKPITSDSRIYLMGIGDWALRTLAHWTPIQMADLLASLPLPQVKTISIISDELGRDLDSHGKTRISSAMDSFAAVFHRRLKEAHRLITVVHARVYRTAVMNADLANCDSTADLRCGQKITFKQQCGSAEQGPQHHRIHSKLRFLWEGDTQKREWAY